MKSSDSIANLADALVKANLLLANPTKTEHVKAGARSYSFAPLPEILEEVRPVLQTHGLAVVQEVADDGISTRILHTSGEWLEVGPLTMPSGNDSQSKGSATTYGRRYQLLGALGIAADEDDDGAKAKKSPAAHAATKTEKGGRELDAGSGPATTRAQSFPDGGSLTNVTATPSVAGDTASEPEPSSGSEAPTPDGEGMTDGGAPHGGTAPSSSGTSEASAEGEAAGASEGSPEEVGATGKGASASSVEPSQETHVHGEWTPAPRAGFVICGRERNGKPCGYAEKKSVAAHA